VKITIESKEPAAVDLARDELLKLLNPESISRVE